MKNIKLALSVLCFALFVGLIVLVSGVDVAAIGPCETTVGLSGINGAVRDALGSHDSLYQLTKYLGYLVILMAAGFMLMGAVQLLRRGSLKKVDSAIWKLAALYAALAAIYVFFEKCVINYRPVLMAGETMPEASFPSSHTMLFCVILGSAAIMAGQYIRDLRTRRTAQIACVILAAAGVAFRLVSGVHWFTDILGGLLISAALLLVFSASLEKSK